MIFWNENTISTSRKSFDSSDFHWVSNEKSPANTTGTLPYTKDNELLSEIRGKFGKCYCDQMLYFIDLFGDDLAVWALRTEAVRYRYRETTAFFVIAIRGREHDSIVRYRTGKSEIDSWWPDQHAFAVLGHLHPQMIFLQCALIFFTEDTLLMGIFIINEELSIPCLHYSKDDFWNVCHSMCVYGDLFFCFFGFRF